MTETVGTREINGHRIAFAFHDTGSPRIAIFSHGFRSSMIGPNRFFVRLARDLNDRGVSCLRFDQYGSGNSEGSFVDSSFADWIVAITDLARSYAADGYRVALLGQSMGGAAAICAAANLGATVSGVAAWMPGLNAIEPPIGSADELMEEGGQSVRWQYWNEAYKADILGAFRRIKAPAHVWLATDDMYVTPAQNALLFEAAGPNQTVEVMEGYTHSTWTLPQADRVLTATADFLQSCLA